MSTFDGNRNLTHQITYQLGRAIVQGKYPVGDSFPTEAQMCRDYQISRSVIREAVKMLTAKGLVSSRPRQGIRVLPPSAWNVFDPDVLQWSFSGRPSLALQREFTELRLALEPDAAALAARRSSEASLAKLEGGLARLAAAARGAEDPLEAVIDFHSAVLQASGNRFFVQLCHFIRIAIGVEVAAGHYSPDGLPDYQAVVEAIAEANELAARGAMTRLLALTGSRADVAPVAAAS
ncbi:FadR/GntR family transcriptional regulator [Gilvimarinus sp. DA14]|uniref:FadR/GntR family transcriptional regulator n=1 Tax=Gilvimarinus sp. DA14 TaxID=2956798 RepID=UPI0020B71C7D|nr:FadR/GntR family transcriptional regulator [Gilvimarinus sp. DA14]UTF59109.1 FadR family transcriptional regulator [Gilvimarinus sp. DA14]